MRVLTQFLLCITLAVGFATSVLADTANAEKVSMDETQASNTATTATSQLPSAASEQSHERTKTLDKSVLNPGTDNNHSGLALGKIVISLALVLLLVVGLGWLFKKMALRLPGSRHIKVICTMPLGQRERILVIEIQGKQRVIGVTAQNINLLFELENPLPEEKLASDFHTQLQSFLKK